MNKSFSLVLLLALGACGKAGKIVEVPSSSSGSEQLIQTQQKSQVSSYSGKFLSIERADSGRISIFGDNARHLYQALQVQEFKWDDGVTTAKTAMNIYCLEVTKDEKSEHSCVVNINPAAGLHISNGGPLLEDKSLPDLPEEIKTDVINIQPSDQQFTITIDGEDARQLYETIDFIPTVSFEETGRIKSKGSAPYLMCSELLSLEDDSFRYQCSFTLKTTDGSFGSI